MPLGSGDKKPERSYLSSAVDSINPWSSSRTTTPTQGGKGDGDETSIADVENTTSAPGDHITTTPFYGQSFRTYPKDCPPLNVQWFHAVDTPKRKPKLIKNLKKAETETKPPARPKKFLALSYSDSKRTEARYQKLLEAVEEGNEHKGGGSNRLPKRSKSGKPSITEESLQGSTRVAVNEDYLFDLDIEHRELAPVYWLGPVYEVRRGTWFFQEGSGLRPCEENLAAQLEEGYLKTKPWLSVADDSGEGKEDRSDPAQQEAIPDSSKPPQLSKNAPKGQVQARPQLPTYRLFGAYMNNVATYEDDKIAWMTTDGMLSWVAASVYERFAGGGHMSGVKLIRGYSEPKTNKEENKTSVEGPDIPGLDERQQKLLKRRSAPPTTRDSIDDLGFSRTASNNTETSGAKLQRQLSSLMEKRSAEETEEEIRKRDEKEIEDDYNQQAGEVQGRDIEHLVLVTHGIGQRLGLRMESVNFVHDVNILRKTIKSVYSNSADLKALNSDPGSGPGNCRVQVLPVCWRHLIEFPRQRQRKGEHDLGEATGGEDEYPSLEDITVEGVAFARSLISDLALDILLYQSSYRGEIARVVVAETNRILKLFKERNPNFIGKVHLMGHSLGSAIYFDVLCRQRERHPHDESRHPLRFWPTQHSRTEIRPKDEELEFDFDTQDFFCLGSPVGLFQMLKGRTISARHSPHGLPSESPLNPEDIADPFLASSTGTDSDDISTVTGLPQSVSSPKVRQLFNIFHPSDPISYRLEPLVSAAMASLKPQALPYTKKGIFGNVAPQGLTGIGNKVGQGVSDLWSSFSAGIASNILNRSLGITNEEVARLTKENEGKTKAVEASGSQDAAEQSDERKRRIADAAARGRRVSDNGNSVTLIDDELETLYSTFQKRHDTMHHETEIENFNDESRKARKMRLEESKVRALNRNGRVDYSIQESVLDFNPINTIASHMSYWADEDVNHFVLSQLLSGKPLDKTK